MGAKKKKGKKGKKGAKDEVEPEDDWMKMDGETLEKNMTNLKEKLVDAKIKRNMLQMEKDMVHDFYHNTRSEIKELEARIKNFDTDMQSMEEVHRTQIKVYMQKVKHLQYEHGNNCDRVEVDARRIMKEERVHHVENDKDMLNKKKQQKSEYDGEDRTNIGEIEHKEKELDQNLKDAEEQLNINRK